MEEDTYSPSEAARILRLSKRRVIQLITEGDLPGEKDDGGRWRIPQHAVHARMGDRPPRPSQRPSEDPDRVAELEAEIADLNYRLGRAESRAELTERAESTVREERDRLLAELERERQRGDELQFEANQLRIQLEAARKPWWRKLFSPEEQG